MIASPPTDLLALLIRNEGIRLRPYMDCCGKPWRECACRNKGFLTIGVGRNLDANGIAIDESDLMLKHDADRATAAVLSRIPWAQRLDEVTRSVLVDMAYNMGIGDAEKGTGLLGFPHMLAALERGDRDAAARLLLESKYRGQVGIRAERNADMIRTEAWH